MPEFSAFVCTAYETMTQEMGAVVRDEIARRLDDKDAIVATHIFVDERSYRRMRSFRFSIQSSTLVSATVTSVGIVSQSWQQVHGHDIKVWSVECREVNA